MKKNDFPDLLLKWKRLKILLTMKMFVFFTLALCLSASASSYSQKQRVSLDFEDAKILEVFNEIKAQTGLRFVYSNDKLQDLDNICLDVSDVEVGEVLGKIFENSDLECHFENDVIMVVDKVLTPKSQQESKEVKGVVTDENGETLPGVSVIVKGTPSGTTTDINGVFKINVPAGVRFLTFSFIGMESQDVDIVNRTEINVVMKSATESISEVVITGYQSIDAHKSTSSVATIKSEDLTLAGALSVDNMLEGKVTGLMTMNTSGTVGAAPKIRIRGSSTISGSREPVWVIDGLIYENPVPISAEEINSLDNVNLIGNAISGLNPEDIDRIDVLKDASATAIYGVKAANGVIVVTTKKGTKGKTVTTYSGNVQVGLRPRYSQMNLMNSKERVAVSKEIQAKGLAYAYAPARVGYEGALQDLYDKKISFTEFDQRVRNFETMNTDWFDLLFRNSVTHSHNLSVSGGNDKTTYYFSGGYNKAEGVEINTGVEKFNGLMKLSTKFSPKLSLDIKLGGNYNQKNYNHPQVNLFDYAYHTSRAIPAEENGERAFYQKGYENSSVSFNMLNELDHSGRKIVSRGLDFSANLNYQILPGLTYTGTLGANSVSTKDENYAEEETAYITKMRGWELGETPDDDSQSTVPFGGEYSVGNTEALSYTIRNQFSLAKQVNEQHNLSVILGSEVRSTRYKSSKSTRLGYLPDRGQGFVYIDPKYYEGYDNWLKQDKALVLTDRLSNFASFYGAFTYDFNRKYVLNANFRADGSNNFGQDSNDKFLPVWSVSGKWNLSQENFLLDSEMINLLSLRASYGSQGNVIESETPYLVVRPQAVNSVTSELYSKLHSLPNPNLRWEKTKSYNLGLDYAVLNNKLSGSFEYYSKKGEDLVTYRRVSSVNGQSVVAINGSDMENYGWEASLSTQIIRNKDWTWSASFNIAQNKNKITSALVDSKESNPYGDYLNGNLIKKGNSTDDFYAYRYAGLDARGYPTFHNMDVIDNPNLTEEEYYARVLKFMGSRVPKASGGFVNTLRYKNLTLSASFSFALGNKKRMPRYYASTGQKLPTPEQNMNSEFVNRWQNPGDENRTDIPALSSNPLSLVVGSSVDPDRYISVPYKVGDNFWQMYDDSDFRVVRGDFLRLRSVTLNYQVPGKLAKRAGFQTANIRFQAQNLFVIASKKLNGIDPEQNGDAAMPVTTSFNLGVNVSF